MGKRTVIGNFIHSSWTNLNIRCGKYKEFQTKDKCKAYTNISIEFSREEYKDWCYKNKELIEKLDRPSLDRIDSKLNYTLENIQILELSLNTKKKRQGNSYLNGSKSKEFRGVRKTKCNTWSARITKNKKEKHIGTYKTEIEALTAFYNEFLKINKYEPFDLCIIKELNGKTQ